MSGSGHFQTSVRSAQHVRYGLQADITAEPFLGPFSVQNRTGALLFRDPENTASDIVFPGIMKPSPQKFNMFTVYRNTRFVAIWLASRTVWSVVGSEFAAFGFRCANLALELEPDLMGEADDVVNEY